MALTSPQCDAPPRLQMTEARTPAAIAAALALRGRVFRAGGCDRDRFDPLCRHLVLRDHARGGAAVATARALVHADGAAVQRGYAAQSYDLSRLRALPHPVVELGRICVAPEHRAQPDIPRLLLGAITALVEDAGARLLIGCSSFPGTDPARHAQALAWLAQRTPAPAALAPRVRARETCALPRFAPDPARALPGLPPLLRSYVALGGWVSDHAVIDRDLDTVHVFTAVDVAAIPAARRARLRALAA